MASNEWILVKSELRDTSLYPEVEFEETLDGYEPKTTQKPAIFWSPAANGNGYRDNCHIHLEHSPVSRHPETSP